MDNDCLILSELELSIMILCIFDSVIRILFFLWKYIFYGVFGKDIFCRIFFFVLYIIYFLFL